jgi:hypothetical protein
MFSVELQRPVTGVAPGRRHNDDDALLGVYLDAISGAE